MITTPTTTNPTTAPAPAVLTPLRDRIARIILAVGPRRTAGLWELVIANKLALVAAGVLTRGWTAWTKR